MRGPWGRWKISQRRAGAIAELIFACVLLAGCNNFSLVGLLDTSPPSAPSTLRLLPDATNIPLGGTRQFIATGGSGGYTYSVEAGGAGGAIDPASGLYTAPALPGTDSVSVTDSTGSIDTSTAMVVSSLPLSLTPTSTSLNAGGKVVFTPSGGSGFYSWSMSGDGTLGGATNTGATYTAPWTVGAATIHLTDNITGDWREATVIVSAPTAVQISPSTVTLDAGGSVTFSASGGSGSYSWSKSGDGNLNLVSHIYTALWSAGTATVTVIDAKTPGTAVAAITVNPPAPLVIRQSSTSIYDTGSVTFTASGGSGNPANYSYSMASGPGTGSVVGFKYTPPLGFTGDAVIQVSDVFTLQTSDATVHVTVPVGLAISPKAITIDAGSSLNFTAVAGTAPYSYTKLSGSGTFLDNHDGTATYTAPWATTDAVIQVTESGPKTDDATVTVNLPHLVISPGTTTLNVGQSVTFTGSGGSGNPFNYSYSKLSGSGTFLDNNDGTATYTAPGSATPAVIRLTDSFTHQTRNAIVTVYAPPTLTVTPTTIKVFAGDAVTFTPGGGSGSYSFSRVSGTGTLVGAAYTTIFAETSVIRLTDAITLNTRDATVIACFPLTVIPSSASVQINGTYPFSVSGGVPPYTYSVLFPGNGIIHPSTGLFTAPSGAESDTVKVTDSIANASTASVTVEPPGPWDIVSIDAIAKTGQYASLALDGSGLPRIAYYESQAMELRFATWNGSSWSHQAVDTAGNVGQYCSLALAPGTGYARISYYDSSRHDLKYAKWDGSSWGVPETVDSSGDVGLYTSLALEPGTGYPRISYYDNTSDNLKYASWNGSSWSTQIVDSPGTVGVNTSLALEPGTNYPRISYYKTTSHDLKYAKWDGSSWGVPETVDGVGDVGMYSSLALDAGGNPHISYYDKMYKDLKYASWTGSWVIQVVDNGGDVGMYTSLALEPGTNYPRISYYDNTSGNLKYVSRNSLLVWTIESVDSTNNVGSYSSLKLDPAIPYKPRIAHYDSSSQDLKYAAKR